MLCVQSFPNIMYGFIYLITLVHDLQYLTHWHTLMAAGCWIWPYKIEYSFCTGKQTVCLWVKDTHNTMHLARWNCFTTVTYIKLLHSGIWWPTVVICKISKELKSHVEYVQNEKRKWSFTRDMRVNPKVFRLSW